MKSLFLVCFLPFMVLGTAVNDSDYDELRELFQLCNRIAPKCPFGCQSCYFLDNETICNFCEPGFFAEDGMCFQSKEMDTLSSVNIILGTFNITVICLWVVILIVAYHVPDIQKRKHWGLDLVVNVKTPNCLHSCDVSNVNYETGEKVALERSTINEETTFGVVS